MFAYMKINTKIKLNSDRFLFTTKYYEIKCKPDVYVCVCVCV